MLNESSTINYFDNISDDLHYRELILGCVVLVVGVVGIIGNIISFFIFMSPSMRTASTNIYSAAISFSNVIYLSLHILQNSVTNILSYRAYKAGRPREALLNVLDCLAQSPLLVTALFSTLYLIIAVSADRLILIKFPLKARQLLTQHTTFVIIITIYLFSILYSIPFLFERIYYNDDKICDVTNIKYHWYIYTYYRLPILRIIPCLILTFLNVQITQCLCARKHHVRSLGVLKYRRKQADFNITLMLVINTSISIFSNLLQISIVLFVEWGSKDSVKVPLYGSVFAFSKIIDMIDPSSEFILYCLFIKRFRQILCSRVLQLNSNTPSQSSVYSRLSRLSGKHTRSSSERQPPSAPVLSKCDVKISVEIDDSSDKNVIIKSSINLEQSVPRLADDNFDSIKPRIVQTAV